MTVKFEYAADMSNEPRIRAESMDDLVRGIHSHVMAGANGFVILGALSGRSRRESQPSGCRSTPAASCHGARSAVSHSRASASLASRALPLILVIEGIARNTSANQE